MNDFEISPLLGAGLALLASSQDRRPQASLGGGLMNALSIYQALQRDQRQRQGETVMRKAGQLAMDPAYARRTAEAYGLPAPENMQPGSPEMRRIVGSALLQSPETARYAVSTLLGGSNAHPYLRQVPEGDRIVTYQIDPNTGAMTRLSEAPRWQDRPSSQTMRPYIIDRGDTREYRDPRTGEVISTAPRWRPDTGLDRALEGDQIIYRDRDGNVVSRAPRWRPRMFEDPAITGQPPAAAPAQPPAVAAPAPVPPPAPAVTPGPAAAPPPAAAPAPAPQTMAPQQERQPTAEEMGLIRAYREGRMTREALAAELRRRGWTE